MEIKIKGIDGYMCHCKADNKRVGKNVYSCYVCEPYVKKKETVKQLEQRKQVWLEKVTAHFDSPAIRREAIKEFNRVNNIRQSARGLKINKK